MTELPFAYGGAPLRGKLRVEPEDFFVDEQLGFEASGSGEHWFIHIEKRGANTGFVAKQLAQFAGVTERDEGPPCPCAAVVYGAGEKGSGHRLVAVRD